MKTQKFHLIILVVLTGILCTPCLGKTQSARPVKLGLVIEPNPALTDIEELYVVIMHPGLEPNRDGLVWKELRAKVEHKLVKAGIRMYSGNVRGWPVSQTPVFIVDIHMSKLEDLQKYVFCVQTSLSRPVHLAKERGRVFRADVWKKGLRMQTISVQNMPATITAVVLEEVETFIPAHRAANPPGRQFPNAKASETGSLTATEKQPKPGAKSAVAEYKYVASKNSKVFHKPDCRWAKRIKPENLVGYNSKEEVIKAGKRPCKVCKP